MTGYRHPHLPYELLPPLADYDRSAYLKEKSFAKIDPMLMKKPGHVFFGLISHFSA